MSKLAETLDEAVERIAGRIEGAHERFFDGRIHRDGCKRCAIEAAIRQGIVWAYLDALEICRTAESWADVDGRLQRRAKEIECGREREAAGRD